MTDKLTITYHEDDTLIHTDERPYCSDPTCPCHEAEPVRFVRISKEDHPMRGMIGTVTDETTEDGFKRVTLLNSSFSGYFKPEDLQAIERGTRVLIEVTISDFFQDSMMVAGGWTPLSRIIDIVDEGRETAQRRNATTQCADGSWW